MNTPNQVSASTAVRTPSMFRRLFSVAVAAGALMVAGSVALADDKDDDKKDGSFEIKTTAFGGLKVEGKGKWIADDDGDTLTFTSKIGKKKWLDMGERADHTNGDSSKFGLKQDSKLTLKVKKADLKFPEAGKSASGKVKGRLRFNQKEQDVDISYKVKEDGGKYAIDSASFTFVHAVHTPDGKPICLVKPVCVNDPVTVNVRGAVNVKK